MNIIINIRISIDVIPCVGPAPFLTGPVLGTPLAQVEQEKQIMAPAPQRTPGATDEPSADKPLAPAAQVEQEEQIMGFKVEIDTLKLKLDENEGKVERDQKQMSSMQDNIKSQNEGYVGKGSSTRDIYCLASDYPQRDGKSNGHFKSSEGYCGKGSFTRDIESMAHDYPQRDGKSSGDLKSSE